MRIMGPYSGGLLRLAFTTIALMAVLAGAWEFLQQTAKTAGRTAELASQVGAE